MDSSKGLVARSTESDLAFIADLVGSVAPLERPSDTILNCGLRFDHFVAPFQVVTQLEGGFKGLDFPLLADAMDYAVVQFEETGKVHWVVDSEYEQVYTLG